MMENRSMTPDECQEFRQHLQGAWADGLLDDIADGDIADGDIADGLLDDIANGDIADGGIADREDVATSTQDEITSRLGEHMRHCLECEHEAQSIRSLHGLLESDLRSIGQSVASPSADQIAEILRSNDELPESTTLKRIRRPVKTMLWFTFYALCLLAGFSLIALIIHARSGH